MSSSLTVSEVCRLARTMTWKWAAVDLFYGGAKAGIRFDPGAPRDVKEAVLRAFARALSNEVPKEYVLGLDMGLSEKDAAIFLDELGDRGASVGVPAALGGLPYDELGVTGFGVAEAADAAAEVIGLSVPGARVIVQGFGAVGQAAAQRLSELGAVVVAVSTSAGAIHDPDGLNVDDMVKLRAEAGDEFVREYPGRRLAAGDELRLSADILVPAAIQDSIDDRVAGELGATLIVEGANMPTTESARRILHQRGMTVVPDFIANAGGVVAAAHSMDVRYSPFPVEPEHVFAAISSKLRANTTDVITRSATSGQTTHQTALGLAQRRVREAMRLRGWIDPM